MIMRFDTISKGSALSLPPTENPDEIFEMAGKCKSEAATKPTHGRTADIQKQIRVGEINRNRKPRKSLPSLSYRQRW